MIDGIIIFNQLKEYWFNNKCEDKFQELLNEKYDHHTEVEVKCLEYISKVFVDFAKEKNYPLEYNVAEVLINWGIIMHEQIKDKFNEGNI